MNKENRLKSLASMLSMRGAIAIACFVTVGSGITGILLEHNAKKRAKETAAIVADQVSANVRNQFDRSIGLIEGMKTSITATRAMAITDRSVHNSILRSTLANEPELLGTWTGWEPNAFDGRDASYANTEGTDASGRFVPYWHRSGNGIALSPLVDYEKPGDGDYYLQARNSGKPVMVEPYSYEVDGKSVLMTSIALPVIHNGKAVGVVGADLALDELQNRISQLKLPFNGQVKLMSGSNSYIYNSDKKQLGKKSDSMPDINGSSIYDDPVLGDVIRVDRAVMLKGFNAGWTVRVELPLSSVLADARWAELSLLISALAMIAGLALFLRRSSIHVVGEPLRAISEEMRELAAGNLNSPSRDASQAIEVLQMREAVDVFRENALEKRYADQEQQLVVSTLGDNLQKLADGDLTTRISSNFTGHYQQIRSNFNDAMERLEKTLSSVSYSVSDVRHGSDEIKSASDNLAQRTEQQAAGLEEVAASMAQITSGVSQTAASALKANDVVNGSKRDMENGGAVIRRAIDAMGGIELASNEIADIISVIDGISFQTNLLALNAGVEAARAGDAGKGFAVVASEVRALAQRSSEAAQDIKTKIMASSHQVKAGVALVGEMNEALESIIKRISEISTLASGIADAAEVQSTSLSEVNTAITQMDAFTQQNAAMVEESNAAASNLAGQAAALASLISQFKVSGIGSSHSTGNNYTITRLAS